MSNCNEPLTEFITAVNLVGNPKDQIENFLRAGYVPQPKQLLFHKACRDADYKWGPKEIGFGGARGPGKSHAMFAQITLDDCRRTPGLKCLMLRKVGMALRESTEDLRYKILRRVDHKVNRRDGLITFPNGSRIKLGNYLNDRDIDKHIGLEYDLIGIEECTTLSGEKYRKIRTTRRTSKLDWRTRTYSNANPGGVGHQFYLKHYVRGAPGTAFIPATCKDNAFLDRDYIQTLEGLTGWLRRAWLEGDWNIHAGTYFPTFDIATHTVEPYPVDQLGWTFYLAMDYGYTHPSVFLLIGQDNQNNIYFIDGYASSGRLVEAHHNQVLGMLARWNLTQDSIRAFVAGSDMWKRREKGSVADGYMEFGWAPIRANWDRIPGAMEFLRRLGDREAGVEPALWIFRGTGCQGLIEQLPTMQHDPHNPEDVLKVNRGPDDEGFEGDDYYDAARYGIMELKDPGVVEYGSVWI